jgi:hypothetical protein
MTTKDKEWLCKLASLMLDCIQEIVGVPYFQRDIDKADERRKRRNEFLKDLSAE